MRASEASLSIIKRFESFRAKPYRCPAGIPTIGYGSTFYPGGRRVTMNDPPVTERYAVELLQNLVRDFEAGVSRLVRVPLTQNEFDALVSFVYNVGLGAFEESTLLRLLNDGNKAAAAEQFKRWDKSGGKVLNGLVDRRKAERALFLGIVA